MTGDPVSFAAVSVFSFMVLAGGLVAVCDLLAWLRRR